MICQPSTELRARRSGCQAIMPSAFPAAIRFSISPNMGRPGVLALRDSSYVRAIVTPRSALPLVALCLECPHPTQSRLRRSRADRNPAPTRRSSSGRQDRSLHPSHRPSFRPSRTTQQKRETYTPFYQSPKMNLSCFANYRKFLV